MAKGKSQGKKNVVSNYSLAVKAMDRYVELSKTDPPQGLVMGFSVLAAYLRFLGANELCDKFSQIATNYASYKEQDGKEH